MNTTKAELHHPILDRVSNKLESLLLLDELERSKPRRAKSGASCLLRGYGLHVSELTDILGMECVARGDDAVLTVANGKDDRDTSDRNRYNFGFIVKALRAVLEVLHDYDQDFHAKFSTLQMFSFFRNFWNLCSSSSAARENPIKYMKYITAWPMAAYLHNEPPKKPLDLVDEFMFTGKIRSYLKQRIVSKNKKNTKLWWTWLQGIKRACESAPKWVVEASLREHKERLSREVYVDDQNFFVNFKEKCDKIAKDFKFKFLEDLEVSNSACWERKRSDGGAHDDILRYINDIYPTTGCMISGPSFLRSMIYSPRKGLIEIRGLFSPRLAELKQLSVMPRDIDYEEYMDELNNGFLYNKDTMYYAARQKCQVSAVLEPLKVRLITKGESIPYYYSRSMQKSMHSYLRKQTPFELIGEPLAADHLYRLRDREVKTGVENFDMWVSGDYSAATDNLKIHYTRAAFEAFLNKTDCDEDSKNIFRSVLYEHEVHYGPQMVKMNEELRKFAPDLTSLAPFLQKNGQLMGSVLSFPILNVCNLVSYWISLERYFGRKFGNFRDLPCLTNGDDILFRTNEDHYQIWLECIREVGFDLSIGKNYVHKNLLTVNSKLYRMTRNDFFEIPYFNVGLLIGNSKLADTRERSVKAKCAKSRDYEQDDSPFSANYNVVIKGADNPERAHKRFLHYNKEKVQNYTDKGRLNLSLPYHLGGLGCHVPKTCNYITEGQQRVAQAITCLMSQNQPIPFIYGFSTDGKGSRTVKLIERPMKKYHFGYGPYEEGYELLNDVEVSCNNIEIVSDLTIKYRSLARHMFYKLATAAPSGSYYEEREPVALMNRLPTTISSASY